MNWTAIAGSLATCVIAHRRPGRRAPVVQAKNGDTHITGQGIEQTPRLQQLRRCSWKGSDNTINALGFVWAVTVRGSSNIIVADNIVGQRPRVRQQPDRLLQERPDPTVWDRGRELGMVNRHQSGTRPLRCGGSRSPSFTGN